MIEVTARTSTLIRRLRARAQRIAAGKIAAHRPARRSDWHSAVALWPDLFGDQRDGK